MMFSNRLLASLNEPDRASISPHMVPVDMPRGFVVAEANVEAQYAYFPEVGVGSMAISSYNGRAAEIGMFGAEGFSLPSLIAGDCRSPYTVTIQKAGCGHQIPSGALISASNGSFTLRKLLCMYAHAIGVQIAYTALINSTSIIDRRLARWLLMFHDRSDDDELQTTHNFLSDALNVRRQSITASVQMLEGKNLIKAVRGSIRIRDRKGLEDFACSTYGAPEAEYKKLLG